MPWVDSLASSHIASNWVKIDHWRGVRIQYGLVLPSFRDTASSLFSDERPGGMLPRKIVAISNAFFERFAPLQEARALQVGLQVDSHLES